MRSRKGMRRTRKKRRKRIDRRRFKSRWRSVGGEWINPPVPCRFKQNTTEGKVP